MADLSRSMPDPDWHRNRSGVVATAVAAWGLDAPADVIDLGGNFNHNLRLVLPAGDVVLRIYRPWVDTSRLATIRAARTAVAAAGLPVPLPIMTCDREPAIALDGSLAELEPWVADAGGTDTWERATVAATLLGRLHAALAAWHPADPIVESVVNADVSAAVLTDWLARTTVAVTAAPESAERRLALAGCDDAGRLLADLAALPQSDLPRQFAHGDFGHGNLRFVGDQPAALLDFDFAGIRPRVADLADLAFAPQWMGGYGQLDRPVADRDWDRVADLILQYEMASVTPLGEEEITALPILMARLPVVWVAMGWLMADPVASVAALAPELGTAAWLLGQRQVLAGRWRQLAGR